MLGRFNRTYFYKFCFDVPREKRIAFSRHARNRPGGEKMAGGVIVERGNTRAEKGGRWREEKKKRLWIRAESDIKYIRIFSRDSRRRHGRSESWISFWWVFPFRLLLHFSRPRKPTVQSQPLNTNVNAFGFCGFFTPAFYPSSRPPSRPSGRTFEAPLRERDGEGAMWLFRGCFFDRGRNWDICLVRFPSRGALGSQINRQKSATF